MVCDSQRTKPSSSMVGTRPVGFMRRYSGVLFTPNCMPASIRSYLSPSSSATQSAFFTFTELTRPQIFSMRTLLSKSDGLAVAARVADRQVAALQLPKHLRAAELVVVVDVDDAVAAALQLLEGGGREAV